MAKSIYTKEQIFLAKQLKTAREAAGINQKEAAKALKKSQSYISKIESGQRRIDIVQLKKIAEIYKKNLNYFIYKD